MPTFSPLWNGGIKAAPHSLADVLLVFVPKAEADAGVEPDAKRAKLEAAAAAAPASGNQWPDGSVVVHAHQAVLYALSPYWKARFDRVDSLGGDMATDPATGHLVMRENDLGPSEMQAVETLMVCMYTESILLPLQEDDPGFLQAIGDVYQLANRFDVPSCREACAGFVRRMYYDKDMSAADVSFIMNLFKGEMADNKTLRDKMEDFCSVQLCKLFKNVPILLNTGSMFQQFCELPIEAVVLWAGEFELQVRSENDVVQVLYRYLEHHGLLNVRCEMLSAHVRVLSLTSSMRVRMLADDFAWFQPREMLLEMTALLASKYRKFTGDDDDELDELAEELCKGPLSEWIIDIRDTLSVEKAPKLEFVVKKKDLEESVRKALAGVNQEFESPPFYAEGCTMKLEVCFFPNAGGDFTVILNARMASSGVFYMKCKLSFNGNEQSLSGHLKHMHCFSHKMPQMSSVADLAPYLTNGELHVKLQIILVE